MENLNIREFFRECFKNHLTPEEAQHSLQERHSIYIILPAIELDYEVFRSEVESRRE